MPGPSAPIDRHFFITGAAIFGWLPAAFGIYELVRWLF